MKKKVLLIALICVFCVGCFAMPAAAAVKSWNCGTNVKVTLDTSKEFMKVSGTGEMRLSANSVPWENDKKYVCTLVVSEGITRIESFNGLDNLEIVYLPRTLKSMGRLCFAYCGFNNITKSNAGQPDFDPQFYYAGTESEFYKIEDEATSGKGWCFGTYADFIFNNPYPGDNGFWDVPAKAYYSDAVKWAGKKKITTGVDANHFVPGMLCTRGQVVTFLWRAEGSPAVSGGSRFSDVKSNAYYSTAVSWAIKEGITAGTGKNTFSPEKECTRAEFVTLLWRLKGKPVVSGKTGFTDVAKGSYYYDAVLWAVKNGITSGVSPTRFNPNSYCSRGEIVTFLYRYYK